MGVALHHYEREPARSLLTDHSRDKLQCKHASGAFVGAEECSSWPTLKPSSYYTTQLHDVVWHGLPFSAFKVMWLGCEECTCNVNKRGQVQSFVKPHLLVWSRLALLFRVLSICAMGSSNKTSSLHYCLLCIWEKVEKCYFWKENLEVAALPHHIVVRG